MEVGIVTEPWSVKVGIVGDLLMVNVSQRLHWGSSYFLVALSQTKQLRLWRKWKGPDVSLMGKRKDAVHVYNISNVDGYDLFLCPSFIPSYVPIILWPTATMQWSEASKRTWESSTNLIGQGSQGSVTGIFTKSRKCRYGIWIVGSFPHLGNFSFG